MKDWERVAMTLRTIWNKPGVARVVHPAYGEVVVPCGSKLAATMCAASVWGCHWMKIHDAEVWAAEPGEKPVSMPEKYRKLVERYEKQIAQARAAEAARLARLKSGEESA